MYSLSIELLIFCGCSLEEKNEGRLFEKAIEDAVVKMQFGHWVPLLVHTETRKPFSRRGTEQAPLKMEIFVTQEILKVFVP